PEAARDRDGGRGRRPRPARHRPPGRGSRVADTGLRLCDLRRQPGGLASDRRGEAPGHRRSSRASEEGLALLHAEVGAAVLRPAGFVVLCAERSLLTIAHQRQAVLGDALPDQVIDGGARATLAEHQVVLVGVPRSSQWPSTSTSMLPFDRSHAALASRSRAASGRMAALSKSKWMSCKLAVSAKSFGGAGGLAASTTG